jgi:hypothetical protein
MQQTMDYIPVPDIGNPIIAVVKLKKELNIITLTVNNILRTSGYRVLKL